MDAINDYAVLNTDGTGAYICLVTKQEQKAISKLKVGQKKVIICKFDNGKNEGLRIEFGVLNDWTNRYS